MKFAGKWKNGHAFSSAGFIITEWNASVNRLSCPYRCPQQMSLRDVPCNRVLQSLIWFVSACLLTYL